MIEQYDNQDEHVYRIPNEKVIKMVLSSPIYICPNCDHGIDPHGIDPGSVCGVGDGNRNPCQCLLTPNAIAHYYHITDSDHE